MAWPLSQDYNEAVQNPRTNFIDPELRQGHVAVNALGIPLPCSGNFADVYAVECPATNAKWAVKCFTREVPGLRERYGEISKHLRQAQLPFTVDFGYLEQGIRVGGRWYPVLKMQWVEGFTLNAFVRDNLDRPARLDALARVWLRMAGRLREANIAHGDLQHGNLLLVPDSSGQAVAVKLIDYDGMWVPALADVPSGEVGHPAYQHPQRLREATYRPEVDRFPLLAVAAALRCLQVGGRALWARYDTGDNLLFRQQDFEAPVRSPLFAELLRMNEPGVRELVVALIEAARMPLERVPHVADLLPAEAAPRSAIRPAPPPRRDRTAVSPPPAAPARKAPEEAPIIRRPVRPKRGSAALAGLALAATVAVTAAVGGGLYWMMHSTGQTEKNPPEFQPRQAPVDGGESARRVAEEKTRQPADGSNLQDPPAPPRPGKHEDKPSRPPVAATPILDGPLGEVRRFKGHTAEINGVAFSNDGRLALSGGSDGTVRLWDLTSGKEVKQLSGHQDKVQSVAFSRDGRLALTAALDKTARVWDVAEGRELVCFRGHQDWVRSVAFSADGKRALTASGGPGSLDCTVRLWDVANGQEIQTLKGHDKPVTCAVFTPDDRQAVSGSDDGTVRLWDLSDGRELRKYVGHQGFVYGVAVAGDGRIIASVGDDKTVRLWDLKGTKEIRHLDGHTDLVMSVAFSSDGRVLSGSLDKTVRLWDRDSGRELALFEGHPGGLKCVAISGDDRFILSAGLDKEVRLWRLPPPDVLAGKPDDAAGPVRSFDGHTQLVRSAVFSFDGRHILTACHDGTVRLWETATGRERLVFNKLSDPHFQTIALLPDGIRAVAGGDDRVVRTWDLRDGHELRSFEGHARHVYKLAASPDGRRVVSGGQEPFTLLWELETGEVLHRLDGHGAGTECVCFSPDGRWLLVGYLTGSIRLWDATSGKEVREFRGHNKAVTIVQFSPDSRRALSASRDRTLRLWDVATGKELHRFEGHTGPVEGAALSPDGRRLISGGWDRTLRLWDVAAGKELHRFEGHRDKVWDVAFCPDGRYVVSASQDQTLRLWRVPFVPLIVGRPLAIPSEQTPITAKLPVPDKAVLEASEKHIRDAFRGFYDRRNPSELAALAAKFLKYGQKDKEEPGLRFVYLREAGELAAQAGDPLLSLRAVDEMSKTFALDGEELPRKTAALERAAKGARTPGANKVLAEQALAVIEEAVDADDYEQAMKLAGVAQKAAAKSGDRFLKDLASQRRPQLEHLQKEYAKRTGAVATLAAKPDDAAANRIVGHFAASRKAIGREGCRCWPAATTPSFGNSPRKTGPRRRRSTPAWPSAMVGGRSPRKSESR